MCDGLKEVTELLSGLSSFVKVDKLTKVLSGGHVGIDCVVCSSQVVDVWRKQAMIEYENDIATTTIEVCVCVCVCLSLSLCMCVWSCITITQHYTDIIPERDEEFS